MAILRMTEIASPFWWERTSDRLSENSEGARIIDAHLGNAPASDEAAQFV